MSSTNFKTLEAWMAHLVSGVDLLEITAESTDDDFKRWESGLLKVLNEQELLQYIDDRRWDTDPFVPVSREGKILALCLLGLTLDDDILGRLPDKDQPRDIYKWLRDNYLKEVEGEKIHQAEQDKKRLEMRAYYANQKEVVEKKMKEKEKRLVKLRGEVTDLEIRIEHTYDPDWNE